MDVSGARVGYEFGEFCVDVTQRLLRSRADGKPVPLTPRVFDTLLYLVEHSGQLIDKATLMRAIWPNVVVEENNLNQNISTLRRFLGESSTDHRFIVTETGRGYRFVAEVRALSPAEDPPVAERSRPRPTIQFCRTPDGVRLAYAISGNGSPLVRTAHFLSHIEHDWDSPVYGHLLKDLSQHHRLLRYDLRANGLSDWNVEDISLEAFVTDLETVVDAAGLERFALMGNSMAAPVSIAYAARHPERLTHLVLYGAYAQRVHDDAEIQAQMVLVRAWWGKSNPALQQMWTTTLMPDATPEEQNWLNDMQRVSQSAENTARILLAINAIDVSALLSTIRVPTLVMHAREDAIIPLEAGRSVAASIPGARFVLLEGRNHVILEHDPASARFKEEVLAFLRE